CSATLAVADSDGELHRALLLRCGPGCLPVHRVLERARRPTPLIRQRISIWILRIGRHGGRLADFNRTGFAPGRHGWRTIRRWWRGRWRGRWWWRWRRRDVHSHARVESYANLPVEVVSELIYRVVSGELVPTLHREVPAHTATDEEPVLALVGEGERCTLQV